MENPPATISASPQTALPNSSDESTAIQVILNQWYRDPDPKVKAMEVGSWLSILSGCTAAEILKAWGGYQVYGPTRSNGELIKPTAARILSKINETKRVFAPRQIVKPTPDPVTASQALDVMGKAGFTPKRMADMQKHRMALKFDDADKPVVKKPHWSELLSPDDPKMIAHRKAMNENAMVIAARGG